MCGSATNAKRAATNAREMLWEWEHDDKAEASAHHTPSSIQGILQSHNRAQFLRV
jgi:hypothetical protein